MRSLLMFFGGFLVLGWSLIAQLNYSPVKTIESYKPSKVEAISPEKRWKNVEAVKDIQTFYVEATYYVCSFYFRRTIYEN